LARLPLKDQKRALAFIREAYAVRDFNAFVAFLLGALPKLIRSEVTSYNEVRPQRRESRNWVSPSSFDVPERHEAWARVMHQHPVLAHFQKTGQKRVLRMSDFLNARELRNLALYCEHYGPLGGMLDCLPILWQDADTINAIGVHRQKQFTRDEQAMMDLLRPHLVEAHANALVVSELARAASRLGPLLEANARGVVILKSDRKIDFATGPARRWIKEYLGSVCLGERLPEVIELWVRHHEAAIQQTLNLPAPREPLVINRDGRRLIVKLLPLDGDTALILEEQQLAIDPASIRSLGLSERESEVLAAVASGSSRAEISSKLGMSLRTTESHMLHIGEKLGVSSAVAAAAKAFQASRIGANPAHDSEAREVPHRIQRRLAKD
jgi:DNA-binding CsgD family transcriptional regulator